MPLQIAMIFSASLIRVSDYQNFNFQIVQRKSLLHKSFNEHGVQIGYVAGTIDVADR